jgi:hypothetical protein
MGLLSASAHFVEDTPTAVLVRQVLGAVAEFEKTTLVAKLAAPAARGVLNERGRRSTRNPSPPC